MDGRGDRGATEDAGAAGSWTEGPRCWRPAITDHAIVRYAQRVKGLAIPDEAQPRIREFIVAAGVTVEAICREIWPDHLRLPADPRCSFAMKRDGFVYIVRQGALITVTWGGHYSPRPYFGVNPNQH